VALRGLLQVPRRAGVGRARAACGWVPDVPGGHDAAGAEVAGARRVRGAVYFWRRRRRRRLALPLAQAHLVRADRAGRVGLGRRGGAWSVLVAFRLCCGFLRGLRPGGVVLGVQVRGGFVATSLAGVEREPTWVGA
jgi:hypothetical protein